MSYILSRFHICSSLVFFMTLFACTKPEEPKQPNILFVISDDQSFAHTGFAGAKFIKTPGFDRVATEGVYFKNFMASSPGCAPSRSSIVTGRYPWQNEQSGQHASSWMKKYVPFVDVLKENGYATGKTGKGVGPFKYAESEADSLWRKEDAAGPDYSEIVYERNDLSTTGLHPENYFENFKYFLNNARDTKPFFFWFGAYEPHLPYEAGSWKENGKNLNEPNIPKFLPESEIVRADILDYSVEIEWYDHHLSKMLDYLESIGELENTIIIVTSDNGMPFPRAKANAYEYGIHVPFAVRYPQKFPGGRVVDDLVDFSDVAPTILDIVNAKPLSMQPISGNSILPTLISDEQGLVSEENKYAFSGRERHSSSRHENWGYPQRAIRSNDFILIWNMKPDRWPAGAPQRIKNDSLNQLYPDLGIDSLGNHHSEWAFTDIDEIPTKAYMVEGHDNPSISNYLSLAVDKRPEFELFNINTDPACLDNLVGKKEFQDTEVELKNALKNKLVATKDPRVVGPDTEIFDSYIRYSKIRNFPNPKDN
ncbi:sulfatase [Aurantibacter sp.]|uniref:sulfatase family protein n=1 Tax=Aurantibacter sp. TaxID=2807103 RepID=UPI0032674F7C